MRITLNCNARKTATKTIKRNPTRVKQKQEYQTKTKRYNYNKTATTTSEKSVEKQQL